MKQFLVRMDDEDFSALKDLHIQAITAARDDISFNAFVVELLDRATNKADNSDCEKMICLRHLYNES